jgi:protein SCO1/2
MRAVYALVGLLALVACRPKADLPEYGSVPAFSLVDQSGRTTTAETFRGRPWAAAFMFTRCPTICPAVTRAMRDVQLHASEFGVPLHLVSFTVDPDNDTPAVLRDYATRFHADLETWTFLTGDYNVVKTTAENGFKMALSGRADPSQAHFGITHGSHLVLVDRNLKIRGFYRTSEQNMLDQLVQDANRL